MDKRVILSHSHMQTCREVLSFLLLQTTNYEDLPKLHRSQLNFSHRVKRFQTHRSAVAWNTHTGSRGSTSQRGPSPRGTKKGETVCVWKLVIKNKACMINVFTDATTRPHLLSGSLRLEAHIITGKCLILKKGSCFLLFF